LYFTRRARSERTTIWLYAEVRHPVVVRMGMGEDGSARSSPHGK
jgi:hypothetical protein